MKKMLPSWALILACLPVLSGSLPDKPNIVLFIADDLGMGDVGCFGNNTIHTPNIDRIAREGAKLSQHIAAASVCTPSRAAFLTGRYPVRSGMVPTFVVRVNMFVASPSGLPQNETTIAELVKPLGYSTGYIGKWHLGLHCKSRDFCHHPQAQGFDHFFGLPLTNLKDFGSDGDSVVKTRMPYIDNLMCAIGLGGFFVLTFFKCQRLIRWWSFVLLAALTLGLPLCAFSVYRNLKVLNSVLMRGREVVEQPIRLDHDLTHRLVAESQQFIHRQHRRGKPFLLVVSWVQVHTALHTSAVFEGTSQHGRYGDNVEELDWGTGEIIGSLEKLGIKNSTLVYFTSDNGGHQDEVGLSGQIEGGFNGIFKGGKTQGGMEGGIRVPSAISWPDKIAAGQVVDQPTSLMDIFSTVADVTGADLPNDRIIDGKSLMPLLRGETREGTHEVLLHYCGNEIHAARCTFPGEPQVWKLHFAKAVWKAGTQGCGYVCDCYGDAVKWLDPPHLYEIAGDPGENAPLEVGEHPRVRGRIREEMERHRASLQAVPDQFSPWRMLPRPWLQPCCNFPHCDCVDAVSHRAVGLD